jgi:hypothetical protein
MVVDIEWDGWSFHDKRHLRGFIDGVKVFDGWTGESPSELATRLSGVKCDPCGDSPVLQLRPNSSTHD